MSSIISGKDLGFNIDRGAITEKGGGKHTGFSVVDLSELESQTPQDKREEAVFNEEIRRVFGGTPFLVLQAMSDLNVPQKYKGSDLSDYKGDEFGRLFLSA